MNAERLHNLQLVSWSLGRADGVIQAFSRLDEDHPYKGEQSALLSLHPYKGEQSALLSLQTK